MSDWNWYFSPMMGEFGYAFEAQELLGKAQVRKMTKIVVGPRGEIGMMRWPAIQGQMCEPMGTVDLAGLCHFPANKATAEKLEDLWKHEGLIAPVNGNRLRLS